MSEAKHRTLQVLIAAVAALGVVGAISWAVVESARLEREAEVKVQQERPTRIWERERDHQVDGQ